MTSRLKKTKKFQKNTKKMVCKTRVRMRGGAYDTNQNFKFPDTQIEHSARAQENPDEPKHGRTTKMIVNKTEIITPEFSNVNSIIHFTTSNGIKYAIAKDPNLFASVSKDMFAKYKPMVDGVPNDMMDFSDEHSGMFFLHGQDMLKQKTYGLFYLLNRIQLLAVLLNIKKNKPRFNQLQVSLPMDANSKLPDDYNKSPHGYYYKWDGNPENLESFHTFVKMMKQISDTDVTDVTDKMIDELKIPTFLEMLRMVNPKIITMEFPTASTGLTKMNELDGGQKLRKNRHRRTRHW